MANPKLTLKDLMNPKIRAGLTAPQLVGILDQLRQKLPGQKIEIPGTPQEFARQLSGGKWRAAKHLTVLSQWLTEMEAGKRKRILVSMPPRHGKSELISYWFPLWLFARNPERRIILTSYEADFAAHWGRRVRNGIVDFGKDLGLTLDTSSTAAHRWNLVQGGSMVTAGSLGPITGKGADFFIIDDPIKNSEEAQSEILRANLWEWFQTTAYSRLEPNASMIVVATRWHQDDLIGRLEHDSTHGLGITWDVLKFPAIAEESDILGREAGDPLWEERYDLTALEEIKKLNSPYNWSALYQQNPTPEDGGGVKRRWWNFYEAPPAEFDIVIQSWDLAFKDLTDGSFTVGQVWGRKGAQFYLLDQVRDRMNMVEVVAAIRNMTHRYPGAVAKLIEDKANGPAVLATLQHEVPGMIPIKVQASKDARLQAIIPLIQAGNVFLPGRRGPAGELQARATWVYDFIEECAAFPTGTYDDQVDALSQALKFLQPQGWQSINSAWREAKKLPPPKDNVDMLQRQFQVSTRKSLEKVQKRVNAGIKYWR